MPKLTETEVPSLAPELAEGCGTERQRHDGIGFDAEALPHERDYLEGTEMKKQDQTRHSYPSPYEGVCLRNGSRHNPEQDSTENRFEHRAEPSLEHRRKHTLSHIQKGIYIHPRP